MDKNNTKRYRDRFRILLIIYFFSESFYDPTRPQLVGLLKSEVRIQKLDFLIRYPSYLCYELILMVQEDPKQDRTSIKRIVKDIFDSQEPELRTNDMKKFLYGAWEKLDKTVAFLMAHGLVYFDSKRGSTLKQYQKEYYLTQYGKNKVEAGLKAINSFKWYEQRCEMIKKYFGDLKGSDLKALQYEHESYKDALINDYIRDIALQTKQLFTEEFNESL